MCAHPLGVYFGGQEPREFGVKGANVKDGCSQKTRSANSTYQEVGKSRKRRIGLLRLSSSLTSTTHDDALGGGEEAAAR